MNLKLVKIRKSVFLLLATTITVVYLGVCLYLLKFMTFEHKDLQPFDGDLKLQVDHPLDFFNPVPECRCKYFGDIPLIPDQSVSYPLHRPALVNNLSFCPRKNLEDQADIKMFDVLKEMRLDYPSYLWTHTGWVQQMDTTYDAHQWDNQPLVVHVVPFSHNDPGWLNTYESYFSTWSKSTLDTVLNQLTRDKEMKFVWAEVVFLEKWYTELQPMNKKAFKKLLEEKRFEILTGGWVMSDEAITHYSYMLDQLIEGHHWLQQELNYTVETAWALDPFGHSPTMAYLLQRSGIKAMMIQRTHYAVKKHLAFQKQVEFTWRQAWDSSTEKGIFCHMSPYMLYNIQYSCGPDINVCCQFDFTHKRCWQWGAYQEAEPVTEKNIQRKAYDLLDQLRKKSQFFRHNNVLLPIGDDFRFTSDFEWDQQMKNLTRLIWYMNSHMDMKVELRFSTLSEYLNAARKEMSDTGSPTPSLVGDFFTYSDRSDQYWSGYFTSRPILKSLTRKLQSNLRAVEILFSLAPASIRKRTGVTEWSRLEIWRHGVVKLRRDVGLLQHHDAITGTSRNAVVLDYLEGIERSLKISKRLIGEMASVIRSNSNVELLEEQTSSNSFPSQPVLNGLPRPVVFFNPLADNRIEIVKLLVSTVDVQVYNSDGNPVLCQVNPVLNMTNVFLKDMFEVHFEISVGPLGMSTYEVRSVQNSDEHRCSLAKTKVINFLHLHNMSAAALSNHRAVQTLDMKHVMFGTPFSVNWHSDKNNYISNRYLIVTFCKCTQLMQNIITKGDMVPFKNEMRFVAYGTGSWMNPYADKSGAYLFLPDGPAKELDYGESKSIIIEGPVMSSVTTWVSAAVSQTVSLYNTTGIQSEGVHVSNDVNIHRSDNRELAMRVKTTRPSSDFFVDLNGFQVHRRQTQKRIPIQGNFYPMTSLVFIEDDYSRLSISSSQSHAVASLEDGHLEMILDRRLMQDDWHGLREGVQDNVPTTSRFVFMVEALIEKTNKKSTSVVGYPTQLANQLGNQLNFPMLPLAGHSQDISSSSIIPVSKALPCNVHLVNLRSVHQDNTGAGTWEVLLILHNMGFDCSMSLPINGNCTTAQVTLSNLFGGIKILSAFEMNLTGTTKKEKVTDDTLNIAPMEMKTWLLNLKVS